MAAARVMMASASNVTTSSSLLFKGPLLRPPHSLSPFCFNPNILLSEKRFFNCRALYKPSIQTKEEGLPETLDYRVFFLDNSGKKLKKGIRTREKKDKELKSKGSMEAAATIVGEEIATGVVAQIKHQFSYLSQYHVNIKNLSSKVKVLEDKTEDVQDKVNAAIHNSQTIKDGVNNWLAEVKVIKAEAEGILKDKDKVGNGCWKGWCLSLKSRYRLSRQAMKEAPKLDALLAEGEFETVAHDRLPSGIVCEPTRNSKIKQATSNNLDNDEIGNDCWKGRCLNLKSYCWLSRKAVKEAPKLDAVLVEVGGEFETGAHTQRLLEDVQEPIIQLVQEGIASSSASARGGLESRLSILGEVMEAVKDDRIRIVRICGMGGIGKTTMAEEVKKIAAEKLWFNDIPMVEMNQKPNVGLIQGNLAKSLGLILEEDDVKARAVLVRKRLNDENRRILVILDNVWEEKDLEDVGIPLGGENCRCKILLTSRLDHVCKKIAPEKEFNIAVLSDPEARILFLQSLANSPCYNRLAEELVKACAGLPLAIKTIARAVANKSENSWRVALRGLQNSTTPEREYQAVFDTLKVSYDFLIDKEIKKFFRLCCLCPKGSYVPIELLTRYGMALRLFKGVEKLYEAREKAYVDIETLLQSNLLLPSERKEYVKIHDLVWDFALSIASEGQFMVKYGGGLKEWPRRDSYEDYISVSLQCGDEMHEVPDGLDFPNLEILKVIAKSSSLKFPENFYKRMAGLHVLHLEGINVPFIPKPLQHLANLRTLCLNHCKLNNDAVSMIGNLDKLEVLSFAYSEIKELPTEIGKLGGLRLLDLTGCRLRVIAPGVLPGLICLEELYMGDNYWDREGCQAMVSEISSLPKLLVIVIEIPYESLQLNPLFEKVEKFIISIGGALKYNDMYRFQNTLHFNCEKNVLLDGRIKVLLGKAENMDLTLGGLKVLVNESETGEFLNMKTLSIHSCDELVYLVHTRRLHQHNFFPLLGSLSLNHLDSLEDIYHDWNSKEGFTTELPSFGNLTFLNVFDCNKLERIFPLSSARGLAMLQQLRVGDCKEMTIIFGKEGGDEDEKASVVHIEFPNLKHLFLSGLPNMVGFCKAGDAVELPQLEKLELCKLPKLTSLCSKTETLASERDRVSASCPLFNLKGPHTLQRYRNLTSLTVRSCDGLRQLFTPSVAISLGELQRLQVECCKSLEAIVAAEGREEEEEECAMEEILFPKLNHLRLYDLPNLLTIMPKGYTFRWSSLKKLEVDCGGESDKFANMNGIQKGTTRQKFALPRLEDMEIRESQSTELWRNHFPGGCSYEQRNMTLFSLVSNLVQRVHHLEELRVSNFDSLEVVFDLDNLIVGGKHELVIFSMLHRIQIFCLPGMRHVWKKGPQNFEGFHNLTSLNLKDCGSLRYLFSPWIAKCLVKLQGVSIDNCQVMEEVVSMRDEEGEGQKYSVDMIFFPELERLTLWILPRLISLGPGAGAFYKPSLGATNDATSSIISSPIFNEKMALTTMLEKDIQINGMNSTELWRERFAASRRFSYGWREIDLSNCDGMSVLFPSHLVRGCLCLERLHLYDCRSMEVVFDLEEELIVGGSGEHKVVILNQLDKIALYHLPSLTHVWKKGPQNFEGFQNLTSLELWDCGSLKYLFSPWIAKCLVKLQGVSIENCQVMEEVVSMRDEEGEGQKYSADMIFFPELERLKLRILPRLISLGPGAGAFYKPSFGAPNYDASGETHLNSNDNTVSSSVIFNEKVALTTSLEDMEIRGTNSTELWCDHFAHRFSYGWRILSVIRCQKLLVLFSSHLVRGCHHLEELDLSNCTSLEVVFDLEEELIVGGLGEVVILNQLDKIVLHRLPRMTHVWKNVPQSFEGFHNLTTLEAEGCHSLRYLFSPLLAKCLVKLRRVSIVGCDVMEEVVSTRDEDEEGQRNTVDMILFPELDELKLRYLPNLICLGPTGAYAFDKLSLEATIVGSTETEKEGNASTSTSSLIFSEKLSFNGPQSSNASVALVGIGRCQLPTWSLQNLTVMTVYECHKLLYLFPPNIVVRLPVLQRLAIGKCDRMKYVFCSSTVISLEQLSDLKITECEMMEVIVKDKDEAEADTMSKLVFPSLISIKLSCLPNLKGFCLGLFGFEWPSLTWVEIDFCWKMEIFTSRYSNTPILVDVLINPNRHSLVDGDLNTTVTSVRQKDPDNFAFKEQGILTINGFLVAGEYLAAQCPSWSWQSGNPFKAKSYLPAKRQFLITKNVPCLRRARAFSSKIVIGEDKNEANECDGDDKNIPSPRTYDVSITYNEYCKTPCLWLTGYDESKMLLPLDLVLEDIAEFHPRELISVGDHPHLAGTHVSLYASLLPSFIKGFSEQLILRGFQPNVHNYLQLLLESYSPRIPTIQYCFR